MKNASYTRLSPPLFRPALRFALIAICSVSLLTACSSSDDEEEQKIEPVNTIYNRAKDSLGERNYKAAVKDFEEVERQHPYSEWATRGQIMAAYSSYKNDDFPEAIAILERFVKQHPGNRDIAYAYYLIALCYYDQISDIKRDQKMTEDAMRALDEVIRRFPDSEYARDARLKRDLTVDHLAGKEMEIGRYYQRQQEYLASINRFRYVIANYQTTTHTPEALHRLVECYLALGVDQEAKRYASVLGYNYPSSRWYRDSYELMRSKTNELNAPAEVANPGAAPVEPVTNTDLSAPPPANAPDASAEPKTPEEKAAEQDKAKNSAKEAIDQVTPASPDTKTGAPAAPASEQENPIPEKKQGIWQKMKSWF